MSVNNELHEMENQVTKGAKAADPMPKAPNYVPDAGSIEDLGGPTPTNSRPDDGSNKLKTPSATLAQKGDPHFKNADAATTMPGPAAIKSTGYGRGANEEVEAEEELNLEEDVAALLEGEELSDEFQEKAKTVFEAVVKTRIASAKEAIEAQYEQTLVEQVEAIKTELTERVDGYLEYVAQEWINENELQVQSGIRGELSESFMTGLKGLFEEHYVQLPEEKYDVLEAMVSKLDEMETKLNEQIDSNVALTKRLSESVSDNILDDVCEGLALSQKEKLAGLAEGVEFESEEQYREKLVTLREAYFAQKPVTESQEVISEDAPVGEEHSPAMEAYLRALTQFN
jgi:electron transfer flavoprotein alpha subunit|tara:strand:- start:310 stop:1335 length:1026 start_codon:yes stop_codon:yes gene_type:complete